MKQLKGSLWLEPHLGAGNLKNRSDQSPVDNVQAETQSFSVEWFQCRVVGVQLEISHPYSLPPVVQGTYLINKQT